MPFEFVDRFARSDEPQDVIERTRLATSRRDGQPREVHRRRRCVRLRTDSRGRQEAIFRHAAHGRSVRQTTTRAPSRGQTLLPDKLFAKGDVGKLVNALPHPTSLFRCQAHVPGQFSATRKQTRHATAEFRDVLKISHTSKQSSLTTNAFRVAFGRS